MKLLGKNLMRHDSIFRILNIFWPAILVFTLHIFLTHVVNAYLLLPWIDIPMHYLGGLSMACSLLLGLTYLQEHKQITQLDRVIELLLVFTLVTSIAVFWEFSEFSMDQLLGTNVQISLQNTMQDLFMGIMGASTIVSYKFIRHFAVN